jgi:hypothetical protein
MFRFLAVERSFFLCFVVACLIMILAIAKVTRLQPAILLIEMGDLGHNVVECSIYRLFVMAVDIMECAAPLPRAAITRGPIPQ